MLYVLRRSSKYQFHSLWFDLAANSLIVCLKINLYMCPFYVDIFLTKHVYCNTFWLKLILQPQKYGYRCQERKEGEADHGWWRLSMYKSINQIRYLYFLPPLIERSQHLFEQTGHLPLRPIQHHWYPLLQGPIYKKKNNIHLIKT